MNQQTSGRSEAVPASRERGTSTLRAASGIAGVTLISRILGLVRDTMMTHLLGTSWAMGTFNLAWAVPNLLRRLFGEGALSAALVPAFTRALHRSPDEAKRLLGGVTGPLMLGLLALTVVVTALCCVLPPQMFGLSGNGEASSGERGRLLLDLTLILFPYVIPICLVAVYAGAQNALGQFMLPAAAPALMNAIWIGGVLVAGRFADGTPRAIIVAVSWALLLGGFAQLVLCAVPLWRRGFLPRPRLPRRGDPSAVVFAAMLPTMLGLSAAQLSILINKALAEDMTGAGSNTHIYLADRLLLFPHALTALAAATAVFPSLSLLAAKGDLAGVRSKLDVILHGTMLLSIPAAAGMWAVSEDLVSIVFVHGHYTPADARTTALTTSCLVAGLPFLSAAQLYARALYALGDNRTPAIASVMLLFAGLGLNLVFVLGLRLGTEGLTLASSVCNLLNAAWLRARLRMLLPAARPSGLWLLRIVLATAGMLACVWAVRSLVHVETRLGRAFWHLALPMGVGMLAYASVHAAVGGRELIQLLRRRRHP